MYRVLIVDDHAYHVETLSLMIPWTELNVDTVHKAYCADEALDLMRTYAVDIIITDIRMPGMSGLELVSTIRQLWNQVKCIILSGYSDFRYMQQAMHTRAVDYLLKPVEEEELSTAVKRAIADIEQERAELSTRRQALSAIREQLPILRAELLNELLQGRRFPPDMLADKLKKYEVPIGMDDSFVLMLIRIDDVCFGRDFNNLSLFEFAVCNIAGEIFRDWPLWQCKDSHDHLIFVIKCAGNEDLQRIERAGRQLQQDVRKYLRGTISHLLGEPGRLSTDLIDRYQTELPAFQTYISHDQEVCIQIAKIKKSVPIRTIRSLHEPPALLHLFAAGRWEQIRCKLEQTFDELSALPPEVLHEYLLELYFEIASGLIGTAHKFRLPFGEILRGQDDKWISGGSFGSLVRFKEWTFGTVDLLRSKTLPVKYDSRALLVRQVQEYVEKHLDQDVSLQAIADHVYLNPTYLSSLYKQQTGESLSEYLYRLRMEKAAYYLQHSSDRIYEISAKLGFQNTNYFIKLFKKRFDITPHEYRERLRFATSAGAR